jgi:antitoxin component YwqK of YwqJK toxin-antitoxin module
MENIMSKGENLDWVAKGYHKNGQVRVEECGGLSRIYSENGQLTAEWFYEGKNLRSFKAYYGNGRLKEVEEFHQGGVGMIRHYTEDGRLLRDSVWKNGCPVWREYYESGQLKSETPYKDGKVEGTVKEYYESGCLKSEAVYWEGELLSKKEFERQWEDEFRKIMATGMGGGDNVR